MPSLSQCPRDPRFRDFLSGTMTIFPRPRPTCRERTAFRLGSLRSTSADAPGSLPRRGYLADRQARDAVQRRLPRFQTRLGRCPGRVYLASRRASDVAQAGLPRFQTHLGRCPGGSVSRPDASGPLPRRVCLASRCTWTTAQARLSRVQMHLDHRPGASVPRPDAPGPPPVRTLAASSRPFPPSRSIWTTHPVALDDEDDEDLADLTAARDDPAAPDLDPKVVRRFPPKQRAPRPRRSRHPPARTRARADS